MDDIDRNFIDALNALVMRDIGPGNIPYATLGLTLIEQSQEAMHPYRDPLISIAPPNKQRLDITLYMFPQDDPLYHTNADFEGTAEEIYGPIQIGEANRRLEAGDT